MTIVSTSSFALHSTQPMITIMQRPARLQHLQHLQQIFENNIPTPATTDTSDTSDTSDTLDTSDTTETSDLHYLPILDKRKRVHLDGHDDR